MTRPQNTTYLEKLQNAFVQQNGALHTQLIQKAIDEEVDFNGLSLAYLHYLNLENLILLLNSGLNPKIILKAALLISDKTKQKQWIDLALAKNVDLKSISHIWIDNNLSIETLEELIDKGLPAKSILLTLTYIEDEVKQKELLDLITNYKLSLNGIKALPRALNKVPYH